MCQGETQEEAPSAAAATQEQAAAKRTFFRLPNQKGVAEGQTRWHCHECAQSFLAPTGDVPQTCPEGHQPS